MKTKIKGLLSQFFLTLIYILGFYLVFWWGFVDTVIDVFHLNDEGGLTIMSFIHEIFVFLGKEVLSFIVIVAALALNAFLFTDTFKIENK